MLIYASLGDFLQGKFSPNLQELRGSDRPFLVLEDSEAFVQSYPFLMQRGKKIYEVGFPWVRVEDWQHHQSLKQSLKLQLVNGDRVELTLIDEVLDQTQLRNDEASLEKFKKILGDRFEHHTADMITLFIALFDALLGENKRRSQADCCLTELPDIVTALSQKDSEARLPLVVALDRRYELHHKLELIAPKLRSQLQRTAEMIPLGRLQEMDAYCLRDYIRRPGNNAVEKAGARQTLMGIKRHQNFDTPENRFLRGFCDLLHLECQEYKQQNLEARKLEQTIDRFRQEPAVQTITRTRSFAGKPNYVLQQNPIYRSFYQAYLDYVKRRTDKEKIWGFRQPLLIETVMVLLNTACLNLEGSYAAPTTQLTVASVPDHGRYLRQENFPPIFCFLQTGVLTFRFSLGHQLHEPDITLEIIVQAFERTKMTASKCHKIPIWVFWYRPSDEVLRSISLEKVFCIYLHPSSEGESDFVIPPETALVKLLDPMQESLDDVVGALTKELMKYIYAWFGGLLP